MRSRLGCAGASALILASLTALAAAAPPPAPDRWVTDQVGFLSPEIRQALDARLEGYQRTTGRQVVVWIGGTIGNESLETWAARTFEAWRVGVKGEDNGVALFILAKDRRMRIEVGYGLEGLLTDLKSARILREELTPRLREGKRDEAVVAAVNGILGVLGGEEAGAAQRFAPEASQRTVSKWELIGFGVLGLLLLFLIATNPRMAATLLYTLASSGHRGAGFSGGGGYSGGGGGFSGGGGRSGGGGASGSW